MRGTPTPVSSDNALRRGTHSPLGSTCGKQKTENKAGAEGLPRWSGRRPSLREGGGTLSLQQVSLLPAFHQPQESKIKKREGGGAYVSG